MVSDVFVITPLNILSWIAFGFVVGLLVHTVKPKTSQNIFKDLVLAILGSMVGGLTIGFFYGYTMLGLLVISLACGIIIASGYVWIDLRTHAALKNHIEKI